MEPRPSPMEKRLAGLMQQFVHFSQAPIFFLLYGVTREYPVEYPAGRERAKVELAVSGRERGWPPRETSTWSPVACRDPAISVAGEGDWALKRQLVCSRDHL